MLPAKRETLRTQPSESFDLLPKTEAGALQRELQLLPWIQIHRHLSSLKLKGADAIPGLIGGA